MAWCYNLQRMTIEHRLHATMEIARQRQLPDSFPDRLRITHTANT